MSDLIRLPHHDASGNLQVVIEAPLGSTAKLKYDADVKIVRWERALPEGWAYPCAWGFIPSTLCDDGDPLDAGVLFEGSTWPGVVVPARAIGVLRVRQFLPNSEAQHNDRVVVVPVRSSDGSCPGTPERALREKLEQFFVAVGEQTGKRVEIDGWGGPEDVERAVREAAQRYQASSGEGS
ncbi:MAG TPA: inorganic diphosphatase [Polyangiaceae bacterium]|jgi:inorganic pyrophosphatase